MWRIAQDSCGGTEHFRRGDTEGRSKHAVDEIDAQVFAALLCSRQTKHSTLYLAQGTELDWKHGGVSIVVTTSARQERSQARPKGSFWILRRNIENVDKRGDIGGDHTVAKLTANEDSRMASLEILLPEDLERHMSCVRQRAERH